jgi:hypothetical protein
MKDLPERKILSIRKNDFFNIKTLADSLSRLHLLQENNCIKSEGLWMTSKSSENITSELQICIKE